MAKRTRTNLKGTEELVRRVRKMQAQVLADLGPVVKAEAQSVLTAALPEVPVESGGLVASAFVDGPAENSRGSAVSATCGFDHPQAGPIHEGVHGHNKLEQPPHFLRKQTRRRGRQLAKKVMAQIQQTLARLASK